MNPATGEYYTLDEIEDNKEGLADYLEKQNLLAVSLGIVGVGLVTGGIAIPIIIGALIGTVVAEGAEEVVKDIERATQTAKSAAQYQARFLMFVSKVAPNIIGENSDRLN